MQAAGGLVNLARLDANRWDRIQSSGMAISLFERLAMQRDPQFLAIQYRRWDPCGLLLVTVSVYSFV